MNILKRVLVFATFFGCCFSIALLSASLGTNYWVQADAVQIIDGRLRTNSTGHVHFGLFKGHRSLNVGFGERTNIFLVVDDGEVVFNQGLWLATIVFLCLGILFAVAGALFAVINTATTPVEAIVGTPGLYLWNILTVICNVVSVGCWSGQFVRHLRSNLLVVNEPYGWTTQGKEQLGYSFWLVVGSILVHVANCVMLCVGSRETRRKQHLRAPDVKPGNTMLY